MSFFDDFDKLIEDTGFAETNEYKATINYVATVTSRNGAKGVVISLDIMGRTHVQTIYITNRKGEPFFVRGGNKILMPNFVVLQELVYAALSCSVSQIVESDDERDTETERRNIDAKHFDSLAGKQVLVALAKATVDSTSSFEYTKDGVETSSWEKSGTEETNVLVSFYNAKTRKNMKESEDPECKATSLDNWLSKNKGKILNKESKKPIFVPEPDNSLLDDDEIDESSLPF